MLRLAACFGFGDMPSTNLPPSLQLTRVASTEVLLLYMAHCSSKTVPLLQMGIANRDIKLENTLLMDLSEAPVLKLCDFGYSKDELCASISKTMCGEHSKDLTADWSAARTPATISGIVCFRASSDDGYYHVPPRTLLAMQF